MKIKDLKPEFLYRDMKNTSKNIFYYVDEKGYLWVKDEQLKYDYLAFHTYNGILNMNFTEWLSLRVYEERKEKI